MLIREFEWDFSDDGNVAHLARRGVAWEDVEAMLRGRIRVTKNKRLASGDYVFAGQGRGGRPLAVVVARTAVPGVWHPVTGRNGEW